MALPLLFVALCLNPPSLATWPEAPPWREQLPLVSDMARFPSYDLCDGQLSFLAARRHYLDGLRGLYADPMYAPWFDAALADVEGRRLPWAMLYEAHGWNVTPERMGEDDERRNYPQSGRCKMARRKLAELRTLLGERDYAGGILPAAIGVEYWRRAD